MERSNEYEAIAAALAALRPNPSPTFTEELDELAATDWKRPSHADYPLLSAIRTRIRDLSPQRLIFTTGGTALAAIAIVTVVVASVDSGPAPIATEHHPANQPTGAGVHFSEEAPDFSARSQESSAAGRRGDSSGIQDSAAVPSAEGSAGLAPLSRTTHRDIERSAEIGLLAEPADVADDSAQVFSAVHDVGGIVLHSTTTEGRHAGAHFDLLIPRAKLGDALAAFSAIDEVRSRHEATDDITAPTVATGERLQDSHAKIEGLLSQLSAAETESEAAALEAALRGERRHAAGLRSQLTRLRQRADFSRVSLKIETGASATSSGGGWGIDDGLDDAGRILAIAAGVTIVALAILTPILLIGLLAWLAQRTWTQRARNRVLG